MENAQLVAIQHNRGFYANVTKIEWFIGLLCNFSCTYCAEYVRSGYADTKDIFKAVDLLIERTKGRHLMLLLGGGEPSIHPDIHRIIPYMHGKGIDLNIITNGSRSPKLYVDMLPYMTSYTFSVHFEQKYHRTMNTIRRVHEEFKLLGDEDKNKFMQVNVMMVPGYFEEAKEVIKELKEKEIPYIIRRIRPLFDKSDKPILPERIKNRPIEARDYGKKSLVRNDYGYYSEEELSYLKDLIFSTNVNTEEIWRDENGKLSSNLSNANDVSLRKLNKFIDWKCWIGIERLHIYPSGDIYRSSCRVGGKLGNVYENFEFPASPIICTKHRCTCSWAINVSKAKDSSAENGLRINQDKIDSNESPDIQRIKGSEDRHGLLK